MILKFNKTTSIYEKDAYISVDGEEKTVKDLMITNYVPTNFEGTEKIYLLGNEHPLWESKHRNYEVKIFQEWLEELGYDTKFYYVNTKTGKIESTRDIEALPNTTSTEI